MLKIRYEIPILISLFLLSSCGIKEMEFDKKKWNQRFEHSYKYRENMVSDLMRNYLKKGMKYNEVIELLGETENYQNKKTNEISYEIMAEYGWNIDPIEGKNLFIKFDKDSLIENVKLEHWKH